MKVSLILFILGALYIGSGVFFSRIKYSASTKNSKREHNHNFYDYAGVFNVHSKKSSGSDSVSEIISAAAAANLDFIIFNEINPIDQQQPPPIQYGNLSVFYGLELSFLNSRFLYFTSEKSPVFSSHLEAQIFLSNFLETGGEGIVVISHPEKPGYEWDEDRVPAFITGVEVLNLREVWRKSWEKKFFLFLSSLIFYPFNPQLFFLHIYLDEALSIQLWDKWNDKQPIMGYVGSDASSKLRLTKKSNLNFPGYKSIFQMAKNHILLAEELVGIGDQKLIVDALRKGSSYFSIDILGDPKGFAFWGLTKKGQKVFMGEQVKLKDLKMVYVSLPELSDKVKVELYHNGSLIKTFSKSFQYRPLELGHYRVVVKANPFFPLIRNEKWISWIFSNPIFIMGS